MTKDLTTSDLHRRNILNNRYAIQEIESEIAFRGVWFEESVRYTKRQIAQFFAIDERTIDRYLEQHEGEVAENGYKILSGTRLRALIPDIVLDTLNKKLGGTTKYINQQNPSKNAAKQTTRPFPLYPQSAGLPKF